VPHDRRTGTPVIRASGSGVPGCDIMPVLVLPDGSVLVRPSGSQVGEALGLVATAPSETFDVAIVGAGPAGLAAAVYASSEGLKTAVVESEAIGGQAGTSSLIRNYLASQEKASRVCSWPFRHGDAGTAIPGRPGEPLTVRLTRELCARNLALKDMSQLIAAAGDVTCAQRSTCIERAAANVAAVRTRISTCASSCREVPTAHRQRWPSRMLPWPDADADGVRSGSGLRLRVAPSGGCWREWGSAKPRRYPA